VAVDCVFRLQLDAWSPVSGTSRLSWLNLCGVLDNGVCEGEEKKRELLDSRV
jgi:hypothetical protein